MAVIRGTAGNDNLLGSEGNKTEKPFDNFNNVVLTVSNTIAKNK